jgi:RNA binding exosome subunit
MIHNIRFRLFVYKNENEEELIQATHNILPECEIEKEEALGIREDPIIILSGFIDKKRKTKEFFKKLLLCDKNQLIKLEEDLDKKIDNSGNLFLRFSKEDALNEKWTIVDKGDSIHLKIKIAAFPCKKEIAINKVKEAILMN